LVEVSKLAQKPSTSIVQIFCGKLASQLNAI
jgi:hypothetical protein